MTEDAVEEVVDLPRVGQNLSLHPQMPGVPVTPGAPETP